MRLKDDDLRQIDDATLEEMREEDLRTLSKKILEDLKEVRERLKQSPKSSSRPSSNRGPWEKGGGREGSEAVSSPASADEKGGPPPSADGNTQRKASRKGARGGKKPARKRGK
jgi:transposase